MKVVCLRHGQTNANKKARYNGVTNDPLNEVGAQQAFAAGVFEGVEHVYVSPLARTRQTAAICFPHAHQIIVNNLAEMNYGDFENKNRNDLLNNADYQAWVAQGCEGRCPNGESMQDVMVRVRKAFFSIIDHAKKMDEQTVVIVAHGGTIAAIMENFTPSYLDLPSSAVSAADASRYVDSKIMNKWHAANCCGWEATIDEDTWPASPFFTSINCFDCIPLQNEVRETPRYEMLWVDDVLVSEEAPSFVAPTTLVGSVV